MVDWGSDPDVALFIGGPRHCDVENIGKVQTIRVQDTEDIWSFKSSAPMQIAVSDYTYIREKVVLPNGRRATVMRDQTLDRMRAAQIAQSEWAFRSNWNSVWATSPPTNYRWLPKPRKSPEEATAWLHDGKGKEFL